MEEITLKVDSLKIGGESQNQDEMKFQLLESNPENRLVLMKLVLINFKSYAGTVEIGPFHSSFSSVVGPNGSGKSNVIDSLLFVFGFKAKKLRQGKLGDLIHCSASYPNLDFCQVQVHFALLHNESSTIIPNSEIVVSRTVKKTLSSESSSYHLNDKPSSYGKVQELLKGHGVDLDHKRFLILQGEVESISLMKPKGDGNDDGLLEYLEDIIGTTRFAEPIKEATVKLDQLNEEYEGHLVKFKHAQKDTLGLKDKSEEAIAYIQWENNVCRLTNQLCQLKIHSAKQQSSTLVSEIQQATEECETIESSQKAHVDELKSLEVELGDLQDQVQKLSAATSASNKKISEFEKVQVECKETEKHFNQKKKKLVKAIQEARHQRSEDTAWISNFESDTNLAKQDLKDLKERLEKEQSSLVDIQDSLRDKTEVFQTQIETLQKKLDPVVDECNRIQSALGVASSERDIVHHSVHSGQQTVQDATERLETLSDRLSTISNEIESTNSQVQLLSRQKTNMETKVQGIQEGLRKSAESLASARAALSDATISAESTERRGKVYTSIMAQATKGGLVGPGVLGRLGDLGTIDMKYDVGITTSCGSSLDSIVVERVEDAQKCIEFLKTRNLGRATFLCLDKVSKASEASLKNFACPPRAHRLFDLVKMKEDRFCHVFYHALGNTLVTETLDIANKIAYGGNSTGGAKYRVVTLTGQIIDKSGTMSGGGTRVMKGGMSGGAKGDVVTPKQLAKMEQDVQDFTRNVEQFQQDLQTAQQELKSVTEEFQNVSKMVSKLQLENSSVQEELKDAKESLKNAKLNANPDPEDVKRLAQLEKEIKKLESSLEKPQDAAQKIQNQIKGLQEEIMSVGGVRLRTQHAKVQSLEEQISGLQKKLAKLVAEKGTREKNLTKSLKAIEKKEVEVEEIESEIEKIQEKFQEAMNAASTIRDEIQGANFDLESKEESLQELKATVTEKTSDLNKKRSKLMENKAKLSSMKTNLAGFSSKIKQYESELKNLSLSTTGFDEMDHEIEPLAQYTDEQLDGMNLKKLNTELERMKGHFHGNLPNLSVLQEYRKKMEVYQERSAAVEKAGESRDTIKHEYDRLRKERLDTFMAGFNAISLKLKEMYQMITMGGNAELELVDSMDPFSEGVLFSVMPPKKSWKNIANLSGGEKTLSSLALVFALHHFKPTPLYVMDEIDAALDFRNVSIIANYIKQRTRNAQFVIISLRNNMFELADRLVGIYKTDNTSKSITINPHEVENAIKSEGAQQNAPVAA